MSKLSCISEGLTEWVSNTNSQVAPSGGDLTASAVPAVPDAPERFSTVKVAPSLACSAVCTMRATASTEPPGGNGTTNRTGPDGQPWAKACVAKGAVAA